eukprot:TRINITY_DN805_c0_g2_i1.p1 TRINITY_DN805_c0_g2~~TRINITY_DN805_c0_g2_i1.p1  ORF type:complete len:295 (-),score=74.52 TRINITY_DN805_c0_g2_i1:81-965(-)
MADGSVLVIGASGFIGFGAARAFRRAGYTVYGLIRRPEKQADLWKNEIIPVIGNATDVSTYKEVVEKAQIIVWAGIDSSSDDADPVRDIGPLIKLAETSHKDPLLPPKTFIYTSGCMVYGHDERIRDENWPISNTVYAGKRRAIETHLLNSKGVYPIVFRPGWVFGYDLGPAKFLFEVPADKKKQLYGKHHDIKFSWVHVDDLGDAYVAAAKHAKKVAGEIFNIVGYDKPKFVDLLLKGAELAGSKIEIEFLPSRGTFYDELLDATVVLSPQKAIDLLGWTPKVYGFFENLEIY